ncbi:transcriptional regulator GlxA family with amidase domain [Arthrobacter stackebrandtii]|uniref:Transcriptional regulator GlxA family with amidase domain n=1 Tax=Arthrobacter stackebrandtii TaxID=272161 RepID=A0ABS4Z0B9_9MICC|nr:helix-turn-helix domain-containing protein [Arthrobacter stackebrandtii]MBP2414488.1 transcriptional regulator GlxA family with amidase domain [Arthrobacter stackebrandtii]PYH01609.1 AraC family transcriptional regulator [Arthrobacter stackebrandtii]
MRKNPAKASPAPAPPQGKAEGAAPIKVAVLALPDVLPLDFGIPVQILGRNTTGLYDVATCSAGRIPVPSIGGFTVAPDRDLDLLSEVHTVIVPGYTTCREPLPPEVASALSAAHQRGARMVSICTGAFALAQAGILDGLRATTHWESTAALSLLHPNVLVDENVLFVDNGLVMTSAGVAAGIDLCLHLVRTDWGSAAANRAAKSTVAAPRRAGTQSQFIEHRTPHGGAVQPADVALAMEWAIRHLHHPLAAADIAEATALSERTLARRFEAHVGLTPMKWLAMQRVERAKELLETTTSPIDRISAAVGLGSGANFRQVFKKSTSLTPSQYRHAFATHGTGAPAAPR